MWVTHAIPPGAEGRRLGDRRFRVLSEQAIVAESIRRLIALTEAPLGKARG